MVGIAAGTSRITLSSGERLPFEPRDKPVSQHSDLLVRIGDALPLVLVGVGADGEPTTVIEDAAELYAARLAATLRAGSLAGQQLSLTTELGLAGELMLAVPGWWSPQVLSRINAAFSTHGMNVSLVNAAEAAVAGYRLNGASLPQQVVVIDARRSFTSVVVVQECQARPHALLSPTFIHREGGDALDAAVLRHLVVGLKNVGDEIDTRNAATISAAQVALAECRQLREALSQRSTASLQLDLPGSAHPVLVARSELDELATPWTDTIVSMVRTAIEQSPKEVQAALITGGLAAMPLLTQRLSADLELDVHVPENLGMVIAEGANALNQGVNESKRAWSAWRRFLRPRSSGRQALRVPHTPPHPASRAW
ncbi:Hsp70 family protein [Leucobacter albus]|uniref:Hsp70 family protein n=1 Tax=Leucobacter albus TaxID=272210 RepID=A0ABW3TL50_9MICO